MCAFLTLKLEFESQLNQLLDVRKERTMLMTDQRYNEVLMETKDANERRRLGLELSGMHYRRLKRFDIIKINGREKLVHRNENGKSSAKAKKIHFCMASDMFDAIHSAHLRIGHKKEKGMESELKKRYCNITREVIAIYLKLCQTCALKKKYREKALSAKSEVVPDLIQRCQIDVVDMEVETDDGFRYILNYQDHQTKFLIFRPLKTKTPEEVADVLFDIFCLIGVPNVVLCNNENGFCEQILQIISTNWNIKLVRGEFEEDVMKRVSEDIFRSLVGWISHSGSNNWINSLRIIQGLKNRCFNPSIKRAPFEALFGNRHSSSLLDNSNWINLNFQTEDELKSKINTFRQKLDEVNAIRQEISKSHDEANQRNSVVRKETVCLNCEKVLDAEVFCWKCNGALHFNCALTNDYSENPFCKTCAAGKTAVHNLPRAVGKKLKLEEYDHFDESGLELGGGRSAVKSYGLKSAVLEQLFCKST